MSARRVLITGGAGFLGRAILARAQEGGWLEDITIYSRDEHKHQLLRKRWPKVQCVLGDVRDYDRLEVAMAGHNLVIHGGALKYVPEAEWNVFEAMAVNVEGSVNVARAAARTGVQTVVGVSTDKACRPVNVYGATKMLLERLFSEAARWGGPAFITCRYGNVVGSTGSVIPLFQEQLASKGRVLLTDPQMTRFWLSPSEAVTLVLWTAENAEKYRGSVVVPRCAAMEMGKLATAVAGEAVELIGARVGEKQHEELIQYEESGRTEQLGGYFRLMPLGEPEASARWTYASHSPAKWVEVEEMQEMIEEARKV